MPPLSEAARGLACPAPGCLPLEAHDLQGPARPAWPPHRERAEGLAWTRATLAQRAPRTLPPAAPGVQPSLNKVSSRAPERRPHDGCWGAEPCPRGGVVPVGLRNRQMGLGEGAPGGTAVQALALPTSHRPRRCLQVAWETCAISQSLVSCLALGGCGSRGQWGPFRLPCPSPPPLASLMRVVWQGCVRGHLTASGPGKRSCEGPEAGVSLLRGQRGPSQEGMGGRPEAGPLCGFGLKQMVTMPAAQITSAEPRSQAAELPRSRRERGAGSCQV